MNLPTIQALISTVKDPLVGLEYLIFVETENEAENNEFICGLCTKHGNFQNIIQHFQSAAHYIKFLKTNLPSVADTFNFQMFMSFSRKGSENCFLKVVGSEVEIMLGRKAPSILTVKKSEDKWKVILGHFNGVLLNRAKPSNKVVKRLIINIQKKRKVLKKLLKVEKKSPKEKSRRERSRSSLQAKRENSRDSSRRDRSSSESRSSRSRENRHQNR
jgi:hypothetical protein